MSVRPAKTQISLGIRPSFNHVDSEDFDQTDLILRCAHSHFVGFVMSRLILRQRTISRILKTNLDQNNFTAYDSV